MCYYIYIGFYNGIVNKWFGCGNKMNKILNKLTERLWVYGSLRKGEYNDYILEHSKYLGSGIIRGYKLFSLGSFPFIFRTYDEKDIVVVEGYDVDLFTANIIKEMERCAGYEIDDVEIEVIEGDLGIVINGSVFVMEKMCNNYGEVKGGDWVNRSVILE